MRVSLWPPFRIPNSSPSQARFNPDEPTLRLVWTGFSESVTLGHWDWTFTIFRRDIEASMSMGFSKTFPQKSVTLTFECMVAEAPGESHVQCQSIGGHALPFP
jgi:hypothetical protein